MFVPLACFVYNHSEIITSTTSGIRARSWKLPGKFADPLIGKYQKLLAQEETSCFAELLKLN